MNLHQVVRQQKLPKSRRRDERLDAVVTQFFYRILIGSYIVICKIADIQDIFALIVFKQVFLEQYPGQRCEHYDFIIFFPFQVLQYFFTPFQHGKNLYNLSLSASDLDVDYIVLSERFAVFCSIPAIIIRNNTVRLQKTLVIPHIRHSDHGVEADYRNLHLLLPPRRDIDNLSIRLYDLHDLD